MTSQTTGTTPLPFWYAADANPGNLEWPLPAPTQFLTAPVAVRHLGEQLEWVVPDGADPQDGYPRHAAFDLPERLLSSVIDELGANAPVIADPTPDPERLAHAWYEYMRQFEIVGARQMLEESHPEFARRVQRDDYYREQFDWAMRDGSSRLREGLLAGHKMNGLYREERRDGEGLHGLYIDPDGKVKASDRVDPSAVALDAAQAVRRQIAGWGYDDEPTVSIKWVTEIPDRLEDAWRELGVDLASAYEAVCVTGWLGRHDLYGFVTGQDGLTIGLPYVINESWPMSCAGTDDLFNPVRHVAFGSAYGITDHQTQRSMGDAANMLVSGAMMDWEAVRAGYSPEFLDEYLPEMYLGRYEDEHFLQQFVVAAAAAGTKLAQRVKQPWSCAAEELAVIAMADIAGAQNYETGTGGTLFAADINTIVDHRDDIFVLFETADETAAPEDLTFECWFLPYGRAAGEVHPLLTRRFEVVTEAGDDDSREAGAEQLRDALDLAAGFAVGSARGRELVAILSRELTAGQTAALDVLVGLAHEEREALIQMLANSHETRDTATPDQGRDDGERAFLDAFAQLSSEERDGVIRPAAAFIALATDSSLRAPDADTYTVPPSSWELIAIYGTWADVLADAQSHIDSGHTEEQA